MLCSLFVLASTVASAGTAQDFCDNYPPMTYGATRVHAMAMRAALCSKISSFEKVANPPPQVDYAPLLERHDTKGKELVRAAFVATVLDPNGFKQTESNYYLAGWDSRHLDRAKMQAEATKELGLTDDADLKLRLDRLFDYAKGLGEVTAKKVPADADGKFLGIENPDRIAKQEDEFYTANKAIIDIAEAVETRAAAEAVIKHPAKTIEGCSDIRAKLEEMYAAKKPHSIAEVEEIWFGTRLGGYLFRHLVLCAGAEQDGALATSLVSRQGLHQIGGYHMQTLVANYDLILNNKKQANAPFLGDVIKLLSNADPTQLLLGQYESMREKGEWSLVYPADDKSDTQLGQTGYIPPVRANKISAIEKRADGYYVLKSKKDKVQYPIWECVNLSQWGWSPDGKPLFNQKCKLVKMETIVVDYGDTITHPACAAAFKVGRQIKTSVRDLHGEMKAKTLSTWLVFETTPKGPKYLNYFGVDLTK